ncbi:MAG: glycan-binding surface protein [bacterium]
MKKDKIKYLSCLIFIILSGFFLTIANCAEQDFRAPKKQLTDPQIIYDFEEDTQGWEVPDWAWQKADHVGEEIDISKKYAKTGKSSLELKADFPGKMWSAAVIEVTEYFNWIDYGKVSCDIYLPKKTPPGLKAKINVHSGEKWKYFEMSRSVALKSGEWVTVSADLKPGSSDWRGGLIRSNEFRRDIRKLGIRVESDFQPVYEGSIYIDNMRLTELFKEEEIAALENFELPDVMQVSDFEGSLEGWEIPHWTKLKTDHVGKSVSVSDKKASSGKSSLELLTDFPGDDWNGAVVEVMQFSDWAPYGRVSADVYLPENAPLGINARIILTVGEGWKWTEMKNLQRLEPGKWVTIMADLKAGSVDWKGRHGVDDSFRRDVRKVVVRFEAYGGRAVYNGPVYLDNIRLTERVEEPVSK